MDIRIIPRLDIKGPNLVKGIHFEGLRVLGKPEFFAKYYYESGADELFYQDAVASLYGRNSLLQIIEKTSKEIFIPLCVGGGLRSVDDIRTVLRAGADKVAINTAAFAHPELIREASKTFGSSTIVVAIEAILKPDGTYEAYTDYGRESTGQDAFEWALQAIELGAGELMVTSIDMEGTGKGYDITLTKRIAEIAPIPVIACGGAGNLEHIRDVIVNGKADAVSMASILHYHCVKTGSLEEDKFSKEGNIEFLRRGGQFKQVQPTNIERIKQYHIDKGIPCRYEVESLI